MLPSMGRGCEDACAGPLRDCCALHCVTMGAAMTKNANIVVRRVMPVDRIASSFNR
jgi:hypothetical protein